MRSRVLTETLLCWRLPSDSGRASPGGVDYRQGVPEARYLGASSVIWVSD